MAFSRLNNCFVAKVPVVALESSMKEYGLAGLELQQHLLYCRQPKKGRAELFRAHTLRVDQYRYRMLTLAVSHLISHLWIP
jgi:hypothetical protein